MESIGAVGRMRWTTNFMHVLPSQMAVAIVRTGILKTVRVRKR